MKCQYESEILYKLMERDGFNIPSSVPPYEAEIKAYLINQVKQAYPKLTDYEAEWLLYNYTKHLPADFPISSATNVVKATFENVVPFAYQSAILKGNTLVNIQPSDYTANVSTSTIFHITKEIPSTMIKSNTRYFLRLYNTHQSIVRAYFKPCIKDRVELISSDNKCAIFTTKTEFIDDDLLDNKIHFYSSSELTLEDVKDTKVILCEYIEGMENWDIPYFEGMQSVKMPVLTTVGKNLFDGELELGGIFSNGTVGETEDCLRSSNYIKLEQNIDYVISNDKGYAHVVFGYNSNKEFVNRIGSYSGNGVFRLTGNIEYIMFRSSDSLKQNDLSVKFQIEKGKEATPYEPFKSNILSTTEDVTLRGIGEVKDTLDCLTGEITKRIGEVTFNGSESWVNNGNSDEYIAFYFKPNNFTSSKKILCDNMPIIYTVNSEYGIYSGSGITITMPKTIVSDLTEFKEWLSQNPATVQYQLATESIKTVDLTTVNEKGESVYFMPLEGTMSVQSSGEIIQPTFDMSVPVEATTQNLASFIDLEME